MTRHKRTRHKAANQGNTTNSMKSLLRKPAEYRGVYAAVARELGLSLTHVRRVALGFRESRHVAAAIAREITRREAKNESAA